MASGVVLRLSEKPSTTRLGGVLICELTEPGPTTETVRLTPLEPGDRASLLEIFNGLGDRSRQQRFLTAKPRLTESDLRHLTAVDNHDHVALLAVGEEDGR